MKSRPNATMSACPSDTIASALFRSKPPAAMIGPLNSVRRYGTATQSGVGNEGMDFFDGADHCRAGADQGVPALDMRAADEIDTGKILAP